MRIPTLRPGGPRRRQWPAVVLAGIAVLTVVAAGCTPGADAPAVPASEGVLVPSSPPAIPTPELVNPGEVTDAPRPPNPVPRPGRAVLLHLEGPTTSPEATDLVVRTERGLELERFRLAGAVGVHAAAAAHHALVGTADGQWARYAAATTTLSLLAFDGEPPTGRPRVAGETAWWDDPANPWLVRLDTGVTTPMTPWVGEDGTVVAATPDGSHLLIRGSGGDHLVDTVEATGRTLPEQDAVTLTPHGLAGTVPTPAGIEIHVEQLDGADRRLAGTVAAAGVAVPLPDGRVVVVGADSALLGTDGTQVDLPAVEEPGPCLSVDDGLRVVCATAGPLVLVDAAAVTVRPLDGTGGMVPVAAPDRHTFWAVTADPAAPGAAVVVVADAAVTTLLPQVPTREVVAISDDGTHAVLRVGEDGRDAALAGVDGTARVVADVLGVALHPDGDRVAFGTGSQGNRSLTVQVDGRVVVEVPTGRSPAWLATGSA